MQEEIVKVDDLDINGVSIIKQKFIVMNDIKYKVGETWRRAYINSIEGRKQVQEEVPEPQKSAVLQVWGDAPTITQ